MPSNKKSDKKAAKKAILGELESIKELLIEDEADIPLLEPLPPDSGDEPPLLTNTLPPGKVSAEPELSPDDTELPLLEEVSAAGLATVDSGEPPEPQMEVDDPGQPLPGQHSLFPDPAPPEDTAGDGPAPQDQAAQKAAAGKKSREKKPAARNNSGGSRKPQGENPFLPQHIRERLHTTKTLVDQIKESPSFQEAAGQPLTPAQDDMIEQLIAEFMPKIEQTLRQRLKALTQAAANPATEDD